MNRRDVNSGSPPLSGYASYDDPNAALWASITPPSDPTLSTKVRRRAAAFSPDVLAHRLRLAMPGIFPSHATAFYAVLCGAMTLGASVGLLGFAAADALKSESSAVMAAPTSAGRAEPAHGSRVLRETPSLRPAASDTSLRTGSTLEGAAASQQTLATVTPAAGIDDVETPAPPRAKRQHATSKLGKKKAKRTHFSKKRAGSRRDAARRDAARRDTARRDTRPRVRNEKARALARALGS
jgi:hypothetical protein